MGNSKSQHPSSTYSFTGGYCYYSKGSSEHHIFISLNKKHLHLSTGEGNTPFKSIKLDKDFKIQTEVPEKRSIVISYTTLQGKSTSLLRMETIQQYQTWTNYLKSLKRPIWDETDSLFCKVCAKEFNFFRRQHHCRSCGKVVCKKHGDKKMALTELGYSSKQRVCVVCFNSSKGL